ncbi:MAG: hypothetical protein DHS20C12_03410 [Pseudohongiella sp.]|nr:MAG: hypothetical protein DHS20C12_03410 [Pseudohongiella sp.]
MSLLMDALRKAEEAKKKAAQESNSEETTPVAAAEDSQEKVAAENVSEESSAPEVELTMAEIDEVPQRSAVPNLETPLEFEDEEDYVLPTSLAAESEAASDAQPSYPLEPEAPPSPEAEATPTNVESYEPPLEPEESKTDVPPPQEEAQFDKIPDEIVARQSAELDSLESVDPDETETEATVEEPAAAREEAAIRPAAVAARVPQRASDRSRVRDEPGRTTARNVFAAKKSPLGKQNVRIAVGGALGLLVVAVATYFYLSLTEESTFNIPAGSYVTTEFVDSGFSSEELDEPLSIEAVTAEVEAAVDEIVSATAEPQISAGTADEVANEEAALAAVDTNVIAEPPVNEIEDIPQPSQSAANLQPESIATQAAEPVAIATTIGDEAEDSSEPVVDADQLATIDEPSSPQPTNLISFRRQQSVVTVDPNLDRAYAAYQQGALDQAEVLYRQTLANDPRQRDALIGLASIAARNGDSTEALDLYSRLLSRNPSDPIARAGLMDLLPAGSSSEQEAEFKRLLIEYPAVAALSYAHGNFLASNQRWNEAQQAYFRALQLAKTDAAVSGSVNPDYAFNLAVSLEHLNQREPALNYYREALEFSENHPAGFDLNSVRARLANMVGNSSDE